MVQYDDKQFAIVSERLEKLLKKDVENQDGKGLVVEKLAQFQRDPKAWLTENLNPRDYESKATMDWSKWVPRQD